MPSLLDQINEVLKTFEEESKMASGSQQRRPAVYYPLPGQFQRPQPGPVVTPGPVQVQPVMNAAAQPVISELGTSVVDEIKPSVAEIQSLVVDEIKTISPEIGSRSDALEREATVRFPFNLQADMMAQGIIMSEILGKPLARRPGHGRRF